MCRLPVCVLTTWLGWTWSEIKPTKGWWKRWSMHQLACSLDCLPVPLSLKGQESSCFKTFSCSLINNYCSLIPGKSSPVLYLFGEDINSFTDLKKKKQKNLLKGVAAIRWECKACCRWSLSCLKWCCRLLWLCPCLNVYVHVRVPTEDKQFWLWWAPVLVGWKSQIGRAC